MMKKNYIHIYLLGLLLLSVACTGKFREFNTDQSGITDEDLIIDDNGYGIRLGIIQQGIYFNYDYGKGKNWPFQLTQNLNADMFSGYMHDAKPLNGGSHNSDYNMQDGWNSAMWTHMYSYIFPQIYQSENATRDTHPALFGITKILKVEAMHRVTDYYGPIIYKNFADAGSITVLIRRRRFIMSFLTNLILPLSLLPVMWKQIRNLMDSPVSIFCWTADILRGLSLPIPCVCGWR